MSFYTSSWLTWPYWFSLKHFVNRVNVVFILKKSLCLSRLFLLILLLYKLLVVNCFKVSLEFKTSFCENLTCLNVAYLFLWKCSYIAVLFASRMLKLSRFAQPLLNMSYTLNLLFFMSVLVVNVVLFFFYFCRAVSKNIQLRCF